MPVMFRSTKEIDRHVANDVKLKCQSDTERRLRGLNYGKLYFRYKDYKNAERYINDYLSVCPTSAEAYNLLGQIKEINFETDAALSHFKKSFEFDPKQDQLLLRICKLLLSICNYADHESIKPWLERAEEVYPQDAVVIELRKMIHLNESRSPRTPQRISPNLLSPRNCQNNLSAPSNNATPVSDGKSEAYLSRVLTIQEQSLKAIVARQEVLTENNHAMMELLKQHSSHMKTMQTQLDKVTSSLERLSVSQKSLKDVLFDFMNQDYEDYTAQRDGHYHQQDSRHYHHQENNENAYGAGPPSNVQSSYYNYAPEQFGQQFGQLPLEVTSPGLAAIKFNLTPDALRQQQLSPNIPVVQPVPPNSGAQSAGKPSVFNRLGPLNAQQQQPPPQQSSLPNLHGFQMSIPPAASNTPSSVVSATATFVPPTIDAVSPTTPKNIQSVPSKTSTPLSGDAAVGQQKPPPFAGFSFGSKFGEPPLSSFTFGSPKDVLGNTTSHFSFHTPPTSIAGNQQNKPLSTEEAVAIIEESAASPDNPHDPEFKPLIPLPDLVETKTGEEDEEVLFSERAKLFRYDRNENQWKERGIGELKILQHRASRGKIRIVMRREQVLKLCANHYLQAGMKLQPGPGKSSDKIWQWFAADYSDEALSKEALAARFKTSDQAQLFKIKFDECVAMLPPKTGKKGAKAKESGKTKEVAKADSSKPLSSLDQFKKKADEWECNVCYLRNANGVSKCVSCESPRQPTASPAAVTSSSDSSKPLSEVWKPAANTYECSGCYMRNDSSVESCPACSTPNPSKPAVSSQTPSAKPAFSFGVPSTANQTTTNTVTSTTGGGFTFGQTAQPKPSSATFSFGTPSPVFGSPANIKTSAASFMFGGGNSTTTTAKSPGASPFSNVTGFKFGGGSPSSDAADKPIFGGGSGNSSLFGNSTFKFGQTESFSFQFSGVHDKPSSKSPSKSSSKSSSKGSPVKPIGSLDVGVDEVDEKEGEGEEPEDSTDDIHFQPVIPLPPKVDVKTGEEDEDVLFVARAKLYRFTNSEWKERGLGDVKLLQDPNSGRVRLLMRREQVLKVCLNHYITSELRLEPNGEKSFKWSAIDYSEEEPKPEVFAIRFKSPEITKAFEVAFENAKGISMPKEIDIESSQEANQVEESYEEQQEGYDDDDEYEDYDENEDENEGEYEEGEEAEEGEEYEDDGNYEGEEDDGEVVVVFEGKPDDEADLDLIRRLQLPLNWFSYRDAPDCSGCRGCRDEDKFVFDSKSAVTNADESKVNNDVQDTNNLFSAAIAQENVSSFGFNKAEKPAWLTSEPIPLFSRREDNESENVDDIYFKPIIPLPDLVEVKTGEEDETAVFCHRAKLYRYDSNTKEWKERGIGDFKILKHNSKCRYRLLLRRDQILKIACNHYISPSMQLTPLATSETSVCWMALDYSDGIPPNNEPDRFAIKFKNKDKLEEFKEVFQNCQKDIANASKSEV